MFAEWFGEYGKVMIIYHGNRYYGLVAHADALRKKAGKAVNPGEVVAAVEEDTGSHDGPELYFEIRHHGKPVNPIEWLAVHRNEKE